MSRQSATFSAMNRRVPLLDRSRLLSWLPLLLWAAFAASCTAPLAVTDSRPQLHTIDGRYAAKPSVEQLIGPYRDRLGQTMSDTIGYCAEELRKGYPEGLLNNFVTDMMLSYGRERLEPGIDFALLNNGGLRVPLPAGPITLGKIYELQPFDNVVVVLSLAPAQMDSLIQMIARGEKEAVFSGLRVVAEGRQLKSATINGQPYDPAKTYRIVTIDYLSDGGSNMSMLRRAQQVNNTGIFVRDFIADYIRREKAAGRLITARLDGRFQNGGPTEE